MNEPLIPFDFTNSHLLVLARLKKGALWEFDLERTLNRFTTQQTELDDSFQMSC